MRRRSATHEMVEPIISSGRLVIKVSTVTAPLRYLFKWGGQYTPQDDSNHPLFRFLFLQTYRLDIPPEYRAQHHYEEWQRKYEPKREHYAASIREAFILRPKETAYSEKKDQGDVPNPLGKPRDLPSGTGNL